MNKTTVVNIRKDFYDVYIGRAGKGQDGYFGNPHVVGYCPLCRKTHKRDEAIPLFREYFNKRIAEDVEFRERVLELEGKRLGCFCKPQECHGDIYIEWLEKQEGGKMGSNLQFGGAEVGIWSNGIQTLLGYIDKNNKKHPCIPKTIENAVETLFWLISDADKETIRIGKEKNYHFDIGMAIRNEWGLWDKNSSIVQEAISKYKIAHGDDLSGLIFAWTFAKIREEDEEDFDPIKQCEVYHKHWAKIGSTSLKQVGIN